MTRVLILGGYGNFGSFISRSLAKEKNLQIVIAGRSIMKAKSLAEEISAEAVAFDIHDSFSEQLQRIRPTIVIHTSGPFQSQSYEVAETCVKYGIHYIDLADGREFVAGIQNLNDKAKQAGVLVISGASSVPCLTSALLDSYQTEFQVIESLEYGITTAQKTTRGRATTAAILSYTGKPFKTIINGRQKDVYGWQGLKARKYVGLGWRLLGNCNVPDLALFPQRYPGLRSVRFYAGLELPFVHVTLWFLSWLVRIGLVNSLEPLAPILLRLSLLFDRLGTANSGFHMNIIGLDEDGRIKKLCFELTARSGDGPFIPCMPAILLTKKIANNEINLKGAIPCMGVISKSEYLSALAAFDIRWEERSG